MDYVRRQPQFNSESRKWKFIAVCKEVDDYVKSKYKAFEDNSFGTWQRIFLCRKTEKNNV